MRSQIEKAAEEKGRSLAQEVESRLERSFELDQVLGPQEHARFLRLIAASSGSFGRLFQQIAALRNAIEARTAQSFESDPATFWAVRSGMLDLLDRMMPEEAALAVEGQLEIDDLSEEDLVDEHEAWKAIGIELARAICPIPRRHSGLISPPNTE
jgi:hypothetical protein